MHGSSVGMAIGPLLQRAPPDGLGAFPAPLPPHRTLPLPQYEKNQHSRAYDICFRRKDICLYSSVVERQSCKLKVLGSIPSGGLYYASMEGSSHTHTHTHTHTHGECIFFTDPATSYSSVVCPSLRHPASYIGGTAVAKHCTCSC